MVGYQALNVSRENITNFNARCLRWEMPVRNCLEDSEETSDEEERSMDIRPRHLMDFTSISGREKAIIVLRKIQKKRLSELEPRHRQHIIRIVKDVVLQSCKAFMPEDGKEYLFQVANQLGFQSSSETVLESSLKASMARSVEKRLIRGLLVAGIGGKEGRRIISRDLMYISHDKEFEDTYLDEELQKNGMIETDDEDTGKRDDMRGKMKQTIINRDRFYYGGTIMAIQRAKDDWYHFQGNRFLPLLTRRNAKVDPRTVEEVVSICFSTENRQMLAHGTKKYTTQDGETMMIPKIRCTKSRNSI